MSVPTIAVVQGRKNKNHDSELYAVEIRLTVDRKVKYVSTGVKVRPANWRSGYVVNQPDAAILNERISFVRRAVEELVNTSISDHVVLDLSKLKLISSIESDVNSFISSLLPTPIFWLESRTTAWCRDIVRVTLWHVKRFLQADYFFSGARPMSLARIKAC